MGLKASWRLAFGNGQDELQSVCVGVRRRRHRIWFGAWKPRSPVCVSRARPGILEFWRTLPTSPVSRSEGTQPANDRRERTLIRYENCFDLGLDLVLGLIPGDCDLFYD
jgi:hypothetical protein